MIFKISPELLNEKISKISECLTDKAGTVNPVYDYVLMIGSIKDNKGVIKFIGSGLQSTIVTYGEIDLEQEFRICIPYRTLLKITKLFNKEVIFEHNKQKPGWFTVKSGSSKYQLPSYDVSLYPIYREQLEFIGEFDSKILREMIQCCAITSAKSETNSYQLKSIRLIVTENKLKIAAFGGSEYSRAYYKCDSKDIDILIPSGAVNSILKILNTNDLAKLSVNNNRVQIQTDIALLQEGLLTGKHPDIEQFLSPNPTHSFQIEKKEFETTIKRIVNTSSTNLEFYVEHNKLTIKSKSIGAAYGQEELEITCDAARNKEIKFALPNHQLLSALSVLSGNLIFKYNYDVLPQNNYIYIEPELNEIDYRYIVSPILLKDEQEDTF